MLSQEEATSYGATGEEDPLQNASYSYSSDEDDESFDEIEDEPSIVSKCFNSILNVVRVVANVDDLWDSPRDRTRTSRLSKLIVIFWFVFASVSYAMERASFKFLVDRTGPFRLMSVQVVTFTGAIVSGLCLIRNRTGLGIPVLDVGLMAILDTISLVLVFLTGNHVAPTLTVILLQFNIPFTAVLTHFLRGSVLNQDGLAPSHAWGALILCLAGILALIPSILSIFDPNLFVYADPLPLRTAINTLLYASSCLFSAGSQIYKEYIFLTYKQPVNLHFLNLLLSSFQFLFTSIISPLIYILQGLGSRGDWTTFYPSKDFSVNFVDGLKCYIGLYHNERDYPEDAQCKFSFALVLIHVVSMLGVGIALDKIVNAGATKVMYRGLSAGIILGALIMHFYDMNTSDFNYGPEIDALNLACLVLLILGSEIYHRNSLPGSTFETVYPEIILPTGTTIPLFILLARLTSCRRRILAS